VRQHEHSDRFLAGVHFEIHVRKYTNVAAVRARSAVL
jgi:hypothetical protein